ncbi:DUF11 domain-containing protein, partial [Loktanella sp. TSTF-M6]|nr:DUF11 domain-containing protein [Loktanella gaetbuli]
MLENRKADLFVLVSRMIALLLLSLLFFVPTIAAATPFTMTVPGTGVQLPAEYPEAGGVAIVMTGVNGNIYYQFSNPDGAFVGFQNDGNPARFRGNPFTINDPIALDCGFRDCSGYFGGAIARVDIRFSAFDGDTQVGGFDRNDIFLILNGFNVGNWSNVTTQSTNEAGTTSFGQQQGFGNETFDTGWFSSTNAALLANILQTNQTLSQVFDRDPNDNFWNFTFGASLPREDLRTVAPGYEFEKTIDPADVTYSQVGDVIDYTYVVRNIGSVDIDDITVQDDRIPNVVCPAPPQNSLRRTRGNDPAANELTCTGTYTITQADIDAGTVTNIATANGTPEFGQLGAVSDTATTTGPAQNNAITLEKVGAPDPFGPVGSQVTYTLTARNTGNTTLRNLLITDPKTPGQTCEFPTLLPLSADNTTNAASCTVTYTVKQADVDAFNNDGDPLQNTATVRATPPGGAAITATASESLLGQVAVVDLTLVKSALQSTYDAVGDMIDYRFTINNTGTVTWPGPPTVTDTLTGGATCPSGVVAPGGTVVCEASYTILQSDLDNGTRPNEATASITVAGQTASAADDVTVNAVVTTELTLTKALSASSPTSFTAPGQVLSYDFILTNTGTVTLTAPLVDDATTAPAVTPVAVTCPAGPIAPGGTLTCTADYSVTQADLDAGAVSNTATAEATAPAGVGSAQVLSDPQSLTVTGERNPSLAIVKTAPSVTPLQFAGEPLVTYTYDVTNSGNVTIPGPITVTDDRLTPNTFTCTTNAIAVGAAAQCTADYQVTEADLVAQQVRNNAFATGGDGTNSNTDSAIIPQEGTFDFLLEKTAIDADYASIGENVDFQLTFTNTGDTTIFPKAPTDGTSIFSGGSGGQSRDLFVFDDPGVTLVGNCNLPNRISPVGANGGGQTSFTCTVRRTVTQADVDAGSYTNTANLTLVYNDGDADEETQVVPPASATVPLNAAVEPSFTLTKTATNDFAAVGDLINYDFVVTNTSVLTLTNVVLTDPKIVAITCVGSATSNETGTIAPGGNVQCTGSYPVTQADLDAEEVLNTVSAIASTQAAGTVSQTAQETTAIDPAAAIRALTLTKSVTVQETGDATFTAAGQTADYVFAVENTGNLTLDNISVVDPDLGYTCSIATLAPGAVDTTTCAASRVLLQADFDAGSYTNDAVASAPGAVDAPASATATADGRVATFVFEKTAPASFAAVGEIVDFTFSFENTGNVTLTNITIVDPLLGATYSCEITSVAPGATDNSCRGSYTVQPADVDAGQIENNASFTGSGVDGAPISGADTVVVTGPAEAPALTVTKVEDDATGSFDNLPATESYSFTVANTGNVTLTGLSLVDGLTGFTCALPDLAAGAQTTLCADGAPLTDTYTVVQADVDAGTLENTATATGRTTRGAGAPVTASDTVTLQGPDQLPVLSMVKTATAGAGFDTLGQSVSYDYLVTNDGNITLTAPIRVSDDQVAVTCPSLPVGGLLPGDDLLCTATDTVDQSDLDAGEIVNVATASVDQPVTTSATYPIGVAAVSSNTETVTVTANQLPALAITKRVKPGTATSFDAPGDLADPANPNNLVYEFIVENTGNVTTTNPITVSDPLISATPLTCTTAPVAPGGTVTCELPYAPTQADVDRGFFANNADAATQFDGAAVVTQVPGTETVNAVQRPDLTIVKTLDSLAIFSPGQIATYRFDVANTGNTTITGPITITDNKIAGPIDCGLNDLAPGDSTFCTATYTVTVNDVNAGSVTNSARASNGVTTSDPQSLTIPIGAEPTLSIAKTATNGAFTQAGDVINYEFLVTNTSSGPIPPAFVQPVEIVDDKITTPIVCPVVDGANPLNPGDDITCTGSYTVQQSDIDALRPGFTRGFVINNAFARSEFAGEVVESPVDRVAIEAGSVAVLVVTKTAENLTDAGQDADAGDVIQFTIVSQNDGPQTLTDVRVTDPFVGALTCDTAAPVTLAPTEALTCTGSYNVTQADVDAGDPIANTANAAATTTQGTPVTGTDSTTYPVASPLPAMQVAKALERGSGQDDFNSVGEPLTFRVTVTNSGNITLNNISVTDDLVPGTCPITTLAPGATDKSCIFVYTVQQGDIDRGAITNIATGRAQPANPGAPELVETGQSDITGPAAEPRIGLSKTGSGEVTASDGSPTFNLPGQTLSYVYEVANLGNVTINQLPAISDDRIATVTCDALPVAGLQPGEVLICRGSDTVDQTDLDAGFVTNIADVLVANEYGGSPLTAQATETITATVNPDISITKTPSVIADATVGTEIIYTYRVQNPGNVTLSDITLVDFQTSAAGVQTLAVSDGGVIASLDPGAEATLTATYTITQDDIDSGNAVRNTVRLTSTLPGGDAGPVGIARARVDLDPQRPEMVAIKTISLAPANAVAGTEIQFQITLTNTGNVTLGEPVLTDEVRQINTDALVGQPALALTGGDNDAVGVFEIGEVRSYSVNYTLTQSDIDAGGIANSVTVTAADPLGDPVTEVSDNGAGDGDDPTPFAIAAAPQLQTTKVIASQPAELIPGEALTYRIEVTNLGNVSLDPPALTEDLRRLDPAATPVSPQLSAVRTADSVGTDNGRFDPTEVWVYEVTHTLTQADIDAGGLANSVTATTQDPNGTPVSDVSDDGNDTDGNTVDDPTELLIAPAPALELEKILTQGGTAVDDTLVFTLTATNLGNVTLSDPVLTDTFTRLDGTAITGVVPVLADP